jgi:hypothetical protein
MSPAEVKALNERANVYARDVKIAGLALRRAALAFLEVTDRHHLKDGTAAGFHVIPARAEDEARLRELAELSCQICFKETFNSEQ